MNECLQSSPDTQYVPSCPFPRMPGVQTEGWQVDFLGSVECRIYLWSKGWIGSQCHLILVEDTYLIESAQSSDTFLVGVMATRNRVFILSHFNGISLIGLKGGLVKDESTVCNFQVGNLCICGESFRVVPLMKR